MRLHGLGYACVRVHPREILYVNCFLGALKHISYSYLVLYSSPIILYALPLMNKVTLKHCCHGDSVYYRKLGP